ncbi:MAG: anti-sigma regulatory factor [Synechococcales bacterium]|nr:anti-sigma regulatory factor [Synechococcales bacterium]
MTLSFTSTLYLTPVLDVLLSQVPKRWQAEVRLGLQEALVNAARHGNRMDVEKQISIQYSITSERCEWIIADQGCGFSPPDSIEVIMNDPLCCERECGRGLFILHQIFDIVQWNSQGTELRLCKQVSNVPRDPLVC